MCIFTTLALVSISLGKKNSPKYLPSKKNWYIGLYENQKLLLTKIITDRGSIFNPEWGKVSAILTFRIYKECNEQ